jgi:hypothetical protein
MDHVRGHWKTSRNGRRYYVPPYYRRSRGRAGNDARPIVNINVGSSSGGARKVKSAVAITITLAVGGIATGVAESAPTSGARAIQPRTPRVDTRPPSVNVSITDFKSTLNALLTGGSRHIDYAGEPGSDCAAHSYGLVKSFFRDNPCVWLTRTYLAVHESSLGEVIVAISWVGMPNSLLADKYKELVDASGTGNVTELSRDTGPYRAIKFDGKYYASGIKYSSVVWNVQVQPVGVVPAAVVRGILDNSKQS